MQRRPPQSAQDMSVLTLIRRVDAFLRSRMKTSRCPFVSARSLSKFVDVEMNATKRPSELTLALNDPLRTVPSAPDEVMLTRSTDAACADAAGPASTTPNVTATSRVRIPAQPPRDGRALSRVVRVPRSTDHAAP